MSLLDGRTSIGDAVGALSTRAARHGLNETRAFSLARWLLDVGLVESGDVHPIQAAESQRAGTASRNALSRLNPIVFKLPLGSPARFFQRAGACCHWLFSPLAVAAGLMLIVYGGYTVWAHWTQWQVSSRGIFAPSQWLALALVWVVLKPVPRIGTWSCVQPARWGGAGMRDTIYSPGARGLHRHHIQLAISISMASDRRRGGGDVCRTLSRLWGGDCVEPCAGRRCRPPCVSGDIDGERNDRAGERQPAHEI